ncbi:transcriptional regulator [Marinomonas sp. CT5]|uniref:MucB/RseB C-terminal domain-containing protein n=1 Tax=Marinomonas sp. CT5 TaxID=2066133 RepID=UPI001859EA44|nr:MucB/RseB C-terminal domain-containing protein [Marinomonas sp. CT5]NVK73477.1 MucB/RseB C-terminal domain-containing protein [Oceanospirillaceae bacterium]QUX94748.1 transcriptional regulator [Marinomonas sp. CT5]
MRLFLPLRFFLLSLCLVSSSLSLASNTTNTALHLLQSMTQSFSTLSYEGVFVLSEDTNMNSMRVRHDLMNGVEYESLVDLDGDKVEVLRVDDKIISVYPNAMVANMRAPLIPPFKRFKDVDSDRLIKGYDLIVGPHTSRIAGRKVEVVKLVPKDQYRYGHIFWLDEENHFLLKHDMMKTDGKLLERIQFTSVNFSPDLKDKDFVPKEGSYAEPVVEIQPRRIKNLWQFDWLPDGFSLVWPEARSLNHGTSMLLLSDGMTTVSVFIEPTMKPKAMSIFSMGATIAGERSIKVKNQLYLLTMVGEVPESTIEKLMTVFMPRPDHD